MSLAVSWQHVRHLARGGSRLLDTATQFFTTIGARACYLLLQIYLARRLGTEAFGLYSIGWAVAGLVGTLAALGMPQAVLRFGIGGRQAICTAPMWTVLLIGFAAMALLLLGADPLARFVFGEPGAAQIIAAFAPAVPAGAALSVLCSGLRASRAIMAAAIIGALVFPLYLAITVLAFQVHGSAAIAGHAFTAALVLALLPSLWLLRRRTNTGQSPQLRQLLGFGMFSTIIGSANILNLWADRLVIGIMMNAHDVGLYQVASQLATIAVVVRVAVITVFEARVPKFADSSGQVPDATREFLASTRLTMHAAAPGMVALAITAGFWTTALFGADYAAAALPLVILSFGQVLTTFLGPAANALQMTGDERMAMRITVAASLVNVVGNAAIISLLGLPGAACALVFANLLLSVWCFRRLRATGRLRMPPGALSDIGVATVAATLAGTMLAGLLGPSTLAAGLTVLLATYVVYGLVVVWGCRVEDEIVMLVRTALRRLVFVATRQP